MDSSVQSLLNTGLPSKAKSDWSSSSGGLGSRGNDRLLCRFHSLCSSVTSATLVLVPLSRKLASGGRTFTPVTVTEPSMAFLSCQENADVIRMLQCGADAKAGGSVHMETCYISPLGIQHCITSGDKTTTPVKQMSI